jgi:hypothetical protein
MVMPFGKHKGLPLAEVPPDYLAWALRDGAIAGPLKEAVERILKGNAEAPFPVVQTKEGVVLAALDGVRWRATEFMRSLQNLVNAIDELEGEGARIVPRKNRSPLNGEDTPLRPEAARGPDPGPRVPDRAPQADGAGARGTQGAGPQDAGRPRRVLPGTVAPF